MTIGNFSIKLTNRHEGGRYYDIEFNYNDSDAKFNRKISSMLGENNSKYCLTIFVVEHKEIREQDKDPRYNSGYYKIYYDDIHNFIEKMETNGKEENKLFLDQYQSLL